MYFVIWKPKDKFTSFTNVLFATEKEAKEFAKKIYGKNYLKHPFYKKFINEENANTLNTIPAIRGIIKFNPFNFLKKFNIFSYTPNIKATVAPDMPGNNSDKPIKIPAMKYLIFSFIHHYRLLIFRLT